MLRILRGWWKFGINPTQGMPLAPLASAGAEVGRLGRVERIEADKVSSR
jgi:hypothetical protein